MRRRSLVSLVSLTLLAFASTASALTIDRTITLDASRLRVTSEQGMVMVEAAGGTHEYTAGHPDLPWVAERIDLPAGMKVTGVEVVSFQSELLRDAVRIAPALVTRPGAGPGERTAADASAYAVSGFVPAELARVGTQGSMRGRNVAYVRIAPTRWDPATGRLERISSMQLRLTVEDGAAPAVVRERIVREWEDELPSGVPSRAIVSMSAPTVDAVTGKPQAEPFKPLQVPSVMGSPVQYLIITNDAMAPAFQPLADWKTQCGVPAVVRTLSFIRQQYPIGADDAERIRLFIRDAYARWGVKWVLLGGDTDVIPERLAFNVSFYQLEHIAADIYYSCLDGNWNADGNSEYGEGFQDEFTPGDNADLLPEVYVGRATVSTPLEAQTFVTKTFQYERTPVSGYLNKWLLFAEVLFPQPYNGGPIDLDGAQLAEDVLPFTDRNPSLLVKRLYENNTDPAYRPGALPESKVAVLAELQAGPGLALHVGHGFRNSMSVADNTLVNADASNLTNGNKLFNLYAIDCTSSAIDFPCIGEAFFKNPNGGAVTVVGSTRFDFPTAGRAYQQEYFRLFFVDSVSAIGELQARQKLPFVAFSFYDGVNRWTQMTLLMLGDPELRMYNGEFRTLQVSGPSSYALGDSVLNVHVETGGQPLYKARVTAYKPNDEFRSALTDGAGNVSLPFRPDSTGAFTITVTAYNARPFQTTSNVTASAAAAVAEVAMTVDDDNVGGTNGNGDGFADAGETVDLRVGLRNRGGAATTGAVSATLATTDGAITIVNPNATYGSIGAGATGNPVTPFRLSIPADVPDQREIPFTLILWDGARSWRENLELTVRAPELAHTEHVITESPGNNDGRPTTGETATYVPRIRNAGSGVAKGVTAKLRSLNASATVTDSVSTVGDIAAFSIGQGDGFVFNVTAPGARFQLEIRDALQVRSLQTLDLTFPSAPFNLAGLGEATSVKLTWDPNFEADLTGYNVYRSTAQAGPFTKVNVIPTERTSYYHDENLPALTRFYYRVTSVDSSGNESVAFNTISVSTNPPTHAIFPVPTGGTTPSSVAIEFPYSSTMGTIAAGSDVLYVLNADGSAPVDADGAGATLGDFTTRGQYYAAGPSMAVLGPTEGMSFIAPCWDSAGVYVFDGNGQVRPGFPLRTPDPVWSSATITDLDHDGHMEIAFGSNGNKFYIMRENGQEWMDGDANPSTKGVFKVLGQPVNFGSPAAADIDNDGLPEIVYGSFDSKVYVWNPDGSNVAGFPFTVNAPILGSTAIGYLDGPGDTQPEIIVASAVDSLYVLTFDGKRRAGWPKFVRTGGSSKSPSPALADMNNDGFLDVIYQSTNGGVYVWNRDGTLLPIWNNVRYSSLTSGASESSPVVADINGDGFNDIVCGGEEGQLYAFSGANASVLPGFPIQLAGEMRGAAALADIDSDGKTEIVLAGWDKNVYVWDYDFTFSPGRPAPWPQFQHDARRTGFASAPLFVGVGDGSSPGAGGPVGRLEFAPPQPNPSRSGVNRTRMWFGIPASLTGQRYELGIYDLSGRLVQRVDAGEAPAGRFTLEWNMRDATGRPVDGGVYFARFTVGGQSIARKLVVLQ